MKLIRPLANTMYLLTEWEGRTGKYLARGHGVRTERSDLTQSISILLYDHHAFPFSFFFFFFSGNKIRNVAQFDRKVEFYTATKLF